MFGSYNPKMILQWYLRCSEENSRLKELLNMKQEKTTDNGKSSNSDMENCAILGIHLPQPTEYEYLRNILFQFMMGREPVVSSIDSISAQYR